MKPGKEHLITIGKGLEIAAPAFFTGRAEMIALDKEHLDNGLAQVVEFRGVVLHNKAWATGVVQAAVVRPLALTVQMRQVPGAISCFRPFC